jgi:hypothetical protein
LRPERGPYEPYREYVRRYRNIRTWSSMDSNARFLFMQMQQVALEQIGYILDYDPE